MPKIRTLLHLLTLTLLLAVLAGPALAQEFTLANRAGCTFATTGSNAYFPLWPGYSLTLEGEEEDDEGELVEIRSINTVLTDTERVDGVLTRVYEEVEFEDGELVEIARNFFAQCRETGDIWYFGEDVDDYEDGMIVGHSGEWRAGVNGALAGIVMPGTPMVGARYYEEFAPGVALDRGEIVAVDEEVTLGIGTFTGVLQIEDSSDFDPENTGEKLYAPGVGNIVDEALELVEITLPPCLPDATTHCLADGRFMVRADFADFDGNEGDGNAILASGTSGEFYFFSPTNTELLVKVIDACGTSFDSFWVFAAGLTNVEVTLTVTDTISGQVQEYENPLGTDFAPVLDTDAFLTCP